MSVLVGSWFDLTFDGGKANGSVALGDTGRIGTTSAWHRGRELIRGR